MSYDYDYNYPDYPGQTRQEKAMSENKAYKRKRSKPGVHVPNQLEAKVLRRLMSETGLTEAEIREIPAHRIELAEASKPKPAKKKPIPFMRSSKPKWNGSKSDEVNLFTVGTVVRRKNSKIVEGDKLPTRDVWIIKTAKYTQKPINDHMYFAYWELELENLIYGHDLKLKEDSRDYEIITPEQIKKMEIESNI